MTRPTSSEAPACPAQCPELPALRYNGQDGLPYAHSEQGDSRVARGARRPVGRRSLAAVVILVPRLDDPLDSW